jgi:hypothetical protein
MPVRNKGVKAREGGTEILPAEWASVLHSWSQRYKGSLVELETYDLVTSERVISGELPLEAIEFDLEDRKNPRINITVHEDNKLLKHILFRPSRLVLFLADHEESLQVTTVNTDTTVHVRHVPNTAVMS